MMNQRTDSREKGAQGVEINGTVPVCDVVPLSHDVGKCVRVVSVKDRSTEEKLSSDRQA